MYPKIFYVTHLFYCIFIQRGPHRRYDQELLSSCKICTDLIGPRRPLDGRLEYVMKGIERSTAHPTSKCLPITPDILLKLNQVWQPSPDSHDSSMLWTAACMCLFGFLQVGEEVVPCISKCKSSINLCFGDVRVNSRVNPQYLEVHIKASKTDPFRQGVSIYLGATHSPLCSAAAIHHYMAIHGLNPRPSLFSLMGPTYLTR